jgi:hypothetical protein
VLCAGEAVMRGPQNLLELEMMVQIRFTSNFRPTDSVPHRDAVMRLLAAGMVTYQADSDYLIPTERGMFWVDYLMEIPYPVERFTIPEVKL